MTPTSPANCRAMAIDCRRLAQQHTLAGRHSFAVRSADRARELTVLALKLEQDSILSNSVPAGSSPAGAEPPTGALPSQVTPVGTNSAVTA